MSKTSILRTKTAVYALLLGSLLSAAASAQEAPPAQPAAPAGESREGLPDSYTGPVSAVAAVVDDRVITTYDVQQRMALMVLSSGQQFTPQQLAQIQDRAVRDLVEEQLKLNEAKKWEVEIPESEIRAELQEMAANSGLNVEQLGQALAQDGISIDSLRSQVRAGIAWPQIVSGRFRSRVRVSEQEIDQTLERMREEAGDEQYLVSEICIPVADPSQVQEYYQGSLQLIEQMRKGVPFSIVAQQFSACTSAAAGGDLGWVRPGELPNELDSVIRTLEPGSVSNPIPSEGALMILALRDKREAQQKGEESYTLVYAGAPLTEGRNEALLGLEKMKTADVCGRSGTRQDLGANVGVALLENVKLHAIDERFRDAVEGLGRDEMSGAVEADGALHAVYICEKDDGLGLPSRKAIEDRIFARQLNRISQQYLRDLERSVHVDIRLRSNPAPQPNG